MNRERHGQLSRSWVSALAEALSIPVLVDPESRAPAADMARAAPQTATDPFKERVRDAGVSSPVLTVDR